MRRQRSSCIQCLYSPAAPPLTVEKSPARTRLWRVIWRSARHVVAFHLAACDSVRRLRHSGKLPSVSKTVSRTENCDVNTASMPRA